ncbi:MAG: winged helix-turn-helix domain-containing protein [Verrucomicrobia bacterium]|nr:winged helix-turn-helix domain-containing protein [Verrucomicrobiota bacterium]
MKNSDVQMGATYLVKVADNLVPVKLTREHPSGGWEGVSVKTGKTIRIKSAQRLRKRLADAAHGAAKAQEAAKDAKAEPGRDTGERGATGGQPNADAKQMSLLDAAAHILSLGTGDPMRCKDIVDLVVKRQLWTPGKGKTPASTLYSSILREITTKGDACRFVKTERGKFALKDSQYIREQAAKAARQK